MEQRRSDGLGRYTGIMAVDVRRFSAHDDFQQGKIADLLLEVLRQAADRAAIPELLREEVFRAFRGDGYLVGFDPELAPQVVDRYCEALQEELRSRAGGLRAFGIELRLRVSLHLGPVGSFDSLLQDSPSGQAMVESGRMVDAAPVRALLDHSDPEVTLVAAVLSEEVMKHVVGAGRTARRPSEFVAAPLEIAAKDYSGTGFLRVPAPSGELLRSGLLQCLPEQDEPEPAAEPDPVPASPVHNEVRGTAGNVVQAGHVRGGIHDHSMRADNGGTTVRGEGNAVAGRDVDQSSREQTFSGKFRGGGDLNLGDGSGRRTGRDDRAR